MAGVFLSFEGIDGCGKSTQAKMCLEAFQRKEIPAIGTREPGGDPIAEEIRKILLFSRDDVTGECEALLYAASRAQHVAKVIRPNLERGNVVICDRFVHSSIAYQGYGLGIDIDALWHINKLAMGGTFPQVIFLFDLEVEKARQRSKYRNLELSREKNTDHEIGTRDRIEKRDNDFYHNVRRGFLEMAKKDNRIVVLDATLAVEALHKQVIEVIKGKFPDLLKVGDCF